MAVKRVVILGGGSIGLFSAYYLHKKGYDVTIVDKHDFTNGCSFGNAGLIVPSHISPMASPGYVRNGIKMIFQPNAPLKLKMPPSTDMIRWIARFCFAATKSNVEKSIPVLREICLFSQSLFRDLSKPHEIGFRMTERGLLMLYKTRKMEHEEIEAARVANKNGIRAEILSGADVRKMEKNVAADILGGVYYPGDNHLDSQELMNFLVTFLKNNGVTLVENCNIKEIRKSGKTGTELVAEKANFKFDELVIAAGTWSAELLNTIGIKISLQPGKGYSFKIRTETTITYPALLSDARVAVCPIYDGHIRFSGGMELGYFNSGINESRLQQIRRSITEYYPEITDAKVIEGSVWEGHRPCSFDGLPYIGKASAFDNVYIGTGHSMLGITLGPATGKLISELVAGERPSLDLKPFKPER